MREASARLTVAQLVHRLHAVAQGRSRALFGITGPPGAGKSTVAGVLAAQLGSAAVVVGMDGFHLAQAELERLGREERKGAPDTFDAAGYVALLRRLRDDAEDVVYAPLFRRDLEEPVAGAVAIPNTTRFVITEGNYLLLDQPGWRDVRPLLDEVWFLDIDRAERQGRLVRRRVSLGVPPDEAERWTLGSDEDNARLVDGTRSRADLVVQVVAA